MNHTNQQRQNLPTLVTVYRRKAKDCPWEPWRAVSPKEANRLVSQPRGYEFKIGES